MTVRTQRLRDQLLNSEATLTVERAIIATEAYEKFQSEPIIIRRAKVFREVLERITIEILPDEVIVGHQAGGPRKVALFPEYSSDWLESELDRFEVRTGDRFLISAEDKEKLREVLRKWHGRTLKDRIFKATPQEALNGLEARMYINPMLNTGVGHIIADYAKVLAKGMRGILEQIRNKIQSLDLTVPADFKKLHFLQASEIACEGAIIFAHRYSEKARELALQENDSKRVEELYRIAEICRHVPEYGARSFREAVQSFWFVHLLIQIESNGYAVSPGRFDQYIYPYLKADLDQGNITREEAQELLDCLWIKFNEILKVREELTTLQAGGHPMFQNLIVGGQDLNGNDVTNELSYMCMQAEANIKLPQPSFSIRYHTEAPHDFLHKACEVVRLGTGKPAMYSDITIIPSLLNRGVNIYDAREYAIVGCVEQSIPGKTYGGHGASKINLAKILEVTLNNGIDPATNKQLGPQTGEVSSFPSFEDFMNAYWIQLRHFVKLMVILEHSIDKAHADMTPVPFLSSLVDDCIEKGQDVMEGGAHYNFVGPEGVGVATTADSLAVIKKLVFEEGKLDFNELVKILRANFENYEIVRQMLITRAPKFGNDNDYVDLIAREVAGVYCREVEKYQTMRGGSFSPGLYTATSHVPMGMVVGATPDGRLAGAPLNDGISPSQGRDVLGPTASIKSVSKLDQVLASNGTLLNMKFNPTNLQDSRSLEKFINMIRSYFKMGGLHVQFNAVSADTLREAQQKPEKYRDLVVRVAGYSAFFTSLEKTLQDEVISRTELSLT
jgi:formate C-acetyltransferase